MTSKRCPKVIFHVSNENGEVFVEDLKSINGTKVNDKTIPANTLTKLDLNSTLNFASAISLKLKKLDLSVASLGLKPDEMASLEKELNCMNGKYEECLTRDCTFVACNQIEFSLDFVLALNYNVQFVKPTYFADLIHTMDSSRQLLDPINYFPKISEQFPTSVDRNFFDFNEKRKTLFNGKIFVGKKDADLNKFIQAASGSLSTTCDPTAQTTDSVFMVCETNDGNELPGNLITVTKKDLMLAVLFIDCKFLIRKQLKNPSKQTERKNGTGSAEQNGHNEVEISEAKSSLHDIENENLYGCSEDVFSMDASQKKRKRSECIDAVNKKPRSSSNYEVSDSAYTCKVLKDCYPDITVVKWILEED